MFLMTRVFIVNLVKFVAVPADQLQIMLAGTREADTILKTCKYFLCSWVIDRADCGECCRDQYKDHGRKEGKPSKDPKYRFFLNLQ